MEGLRCWAEHLGTLLQSRPCKGRHCEIPSPEPWGTTTYRSQRFPLYRLLVHVGSPCLGGGVMSRDFTPYSLPRQGTSLPTHFRSSIPPLTIPLTPSSVDLAYIFV